MDTKNEFKVFITKDNKKVEDIATKIHQLVVKEFGDDVIVEIELEKNEKKSLFKKTITNTIFRVR